MNNNYEVEIIDGWLEDLDVIEVYNRIVKNIDDVLFVGISSYMSNTKPTVELIEMLKKYNKNVKIACGGFGPTFYPKAYLENGVDYIMRGEGEDVIVDLANHIKNNEETCNIKSVGYKKDGKIILNDMLPLRNDLDSLKFPSRDYLDLLKQKKSTVNMVTARGCSGVCDFCSVISFFRLSNGKIWRSRSIKNIVDEIECLSKNNIEYIKMVDDSFIDGYRDGDWCSDFADEIERRNIKVKLRGQIRADKVTDKVLIELKRAGFFSFACGIENGSETALKRMNKMATLEDNKRALDLFKKYDYYVQMGYILFDKDTTLKELKENYEFMKKYRYAITKGIFSEMFSAEGSRLNNRLRKENKLHEGDFLTTNNSYDIENYQVEMIYQALKKWHKSHSKIHDMTIDPITAPKAIDEKDRFNFYKNILKLKDLDLNIFGKLLDLTNENVDLLSYIDTMINDTQDEYCKIENDDNKIYQKTKLNYNAEINPFI